MLCQRLPVKEPRKLCIRGPYRARLPVHEVDIDTDLDKDLDLSVKNYEMTSIQRLTREY